MKEECRNCAFLGEIYFPPTINKESKHLDGCFVFAETDKSVMYLDGLGSMCEMFTPKTNDKNLLLRGDIYGKEL